MEQNLAVILQRFEAQLERIATALDDIHECLEQMSVDAGEGPEGEPISYVRVHEVARGK